jgi:hypothetical protein
MIARIKRLAAFERTPPRHRDPRPKPPTVEELVAVARSPLPQITDEDRVRYRHPARPVPPTPNPPRSRRMIPPPGTGGHFRITFAQFNAAWADPTVRPLTPYERRVFMLAQGIQVPASATLSLTAAGHIQMEQREAAAEALARMKETGRAT